MRSHVVTAHDVAESVELLRRTFADVPDDAWDVPAGALTWTCWETVEHLADDLLFYAMQLAASDPPQSGSVPLSWREDRPGGPANSIFAERAGGTAGLLQVIEVCGVFLAASVRDAPAGAEPWPTLLWATGRGALADHPARGADWRWDARPAPER